MVVLTVGLVVIGLVLILHLWSTASEVARLDRRMDALESNLGEGMRLARLDKIRESVKW